MPAASDPFPDCRLGRFGGHGGHIPGIGLASGVPDQEFGLWSGGEFLGEQALQVADGRIGLGGEQQFGCFGFVAGGCVVQWRVVFLVLGVRVGPCRDQGGDACAVVSGRLVKGGAAFLVLGVDVRPRFEQEGDRGRLELRGEMEWGRSLFVPGVEVSAAGDKQFRFPFDAQPCGIVEGRVAEGIFRIGVGTAGKKSEDGRRVGIVEWRAAVGRLGVFVGPCGDEQGDRLAEAHSGRPVEGGEAIGVFRVRVGPIG